KRATVRVQLPPPCSNNQAKNTGEQHLSKVIFASFSVKNKKLISCVTPRGMGGSLRRALYKRREPGDQRKKIGKVQFRLEIFIAESQERHAGRLRRQFVHLGIA